MSDLRTQLLAIYETNGTLTPALVVQTARDPDHPLHGRFEWDDSVAAEKYRLSQGGELIRSIKISYRDDRGEYKDVRQYHSFRSTDGGHRYEPVEKVVNDPMLDRILRNDMEREWKALRKRWEGYVEFSTMIKRDLAA